MSQLARLAPRSLCLAALAALVLGPSPGGAQERPPAPALVDAGAGRFLALRLRPGQDLRRELVREVERRGIEAAAVVTAVGSLSEVTLRYANRPGGTLVRGHLEVVSLVGTLSRHGSHLHLAVSDGEGRTLGGHLLDGSKVYTTLEVVLVALPDVRFVRRPDPETTYRELVIEPAKAGR